MDAGFIKLIRSPETLELIQKPKVLALLALIAYRAKRTAGISVDGLKPGEAMVGDSRACGLSRQEYRTALAILQNAQILTIRTTNKGTIAKLTDTRVFDINEECEQPSSQPKSNHQATTNKEVKNVKNINMLKNISNGFDSFWDVYPRKKGKKQALKAWQKIKPSPVLQKQILSAVQKQKYSKDWLKESGQFIPYPATWLNGELWNDELTPQTQSKFSM